MGLLANTPGVLLGPGCKTGRFICFSRRRALARSPLPPAASPPLGRCVAGNRGVGGSPADCCLLGQNARALIYVSTSGHPTTTSRDDHMSPHARGRRRWGVLARAAVAALLPPAHSTAPADAGEADASEVEAPRRLFMARPVLLNCGALC